MLLLSNRPMLHLGQAATYPDKMFGSRCFILLRIWRPRVSTRAILPSFEGDAPFRMDFRDSISAFQAVSSVSSALTAPEWAAAIATDCPIIATHGTSKVAEGPWPERSAWTAARLLWSDAAWSTLLITPMVLVPTVEKMNVSNGPCWIDHSINSYGGWKCLLTIRIQILSKLQSPRNSNITTWGCWYYHQ